MFQSLVGSLLVLASLAPAVAHAASDLAYFQQFILKEEKTDDGDGDVKITYHYLVPGIVEVPVDATHEIRPSLDLLMTAEGKFRAFYGETHWERDNATAPWRFVASFDCDSVIDGAWSVPDSRLLVGDIGTGARGIWQGQNAVAFTFARAIKDPIMAGKTLTLSYGISNTGMDRPVQPWCH